MARRKFSETEREFIAKQANYRCSYCRSPQAIGIPMVVDHIVPLNSGGNSEFDNLCLACYRCNEFKGAKTEAIDPLTQAKAPLFNPKQQQWLEHFAWSRDYRSIVGLTVSGRATIEQLKLNSKRLTTARQIWRLVGLHPPLE